MQCLIEILSQRFSKTPHSSRAFKRSTLFMQNLLQKICIAVLAEYAHERQPLQNIRQEVLLFHLWRPERLAKAYERS